MSLLPSGAIETGGYDINNSVRFRSSASAYLNRTPASAGNRRTWTWSGWVKRGAIANRQGLFDGYSNGTNFTQLIFESDHRLYLYTCVGSPSFIDYSYETVAVFRDPSAWYHIVVAVNTTHATQSERCIFYVNGIRQTLTSAYGQLDQNFDTYINSTSSHSIGRAVDPNAYLDGYMTEINFIDGQALTPSSFGETDTTTGVWKPKKYTGTYGTNGFYLKFSDIATTSGSNAGLGKDFSGNSNYWTTNNISVTAGTTYDAMTDSPTNTSATVANYPTLNPLSNTSTLTEANLTATNILQAGTTMATPSTGKWYFEYTQTTSIPSGSLWVGVSSNTNAIADNQLQGYAYASDGRKVAYNSYTSGYGATWTNGDVIGCALDLDNQTITFYKNNVSQGTAFTSITAQPYVFALSAGGVASTKGGSINCGQRPFSYTPPTGFVALNTYNLPTSTILQGNKYMDATLYTGNGANRSITNAGAFKPDAIWIKTRSAGAYNHHLVDSVRGTTKNLRPNTTGAEDTVSDQITAINSNGFSLGVDTAGPADSEVNVNGNTYVAWQWQAGQGSTSSNTSGSITSTVSVNTTAGFSIVTYTGNGSSPVTIGHGLGVAPKFIIIKDRSVVSSWVVQHTSLGWTQGFLGITTAAASTSTLFSNNTAPTSSVFTVGGYSNNNAENYVAYCWAEIAGFSAFGSYTGNGSTEGPFQYCGFRPRWIMWKRTSSISSWVIWDTARNTYNAANSVLFPDTSDAESTNTAYDIDVLSNGFKMRTSNATMNGSGSTYIFAAFAENPFKNSLAR